MELNLDTFISDFKTELRRHGDIYAVGAVDEAIRIAVATAKDRQAPEASVGPIAINEPEPTAAEPVAEPISALDTLEDTGGAVDE